MTRILICGGRDYDDHLAVHRALIPYKPHPWNACSEHIIIHGGCRTGADHWADLWCDTFGVRKRVYPANWTRDGRAAGPIRNSRMLAEGKPDLVLAFPGGRGTADMVRKATAAGIPVTFCGSASAANDKDALSDQQNGGSHG